MKKIWEQKKHLTAIALILAMSLTLILPAAVTVQADTGEAEFLAAQPISMGQTVMGVIDQTGDTSENGELQCYSFYLPSAGSIDIDITAYFEQYSMYIYDNAGKRLGYSDHNYWTESVGYRKDDYQVYLEQGNYYIKITSYDENSNSYTGTYNFSINFKSTNTTNHESDNSFAEANVISLGQSVVGQISKNDDLDTFCFTTNTSGRVKLDITAYMQNYCILLFDKDGKRIWYTDENTWNENVGYRNDIYQVDLEQGSYYIQVKGTYLYNSDSYYMGYYKLSTGFENANATNQESDNSFDAANEISLNKTYKGQIALNDDLDTYYIRLTKSGTYRLVVASYMKYYCVCMYRQNGQRIWYTDENTWNENVGYRKDSYDISLSAGIYYIQMKGTYLYNSSSGATGTYNFGLKKLSLKSIKLTEKSITVYKGYTHQLYYTLNPTSISTTLKWKSSNKRIASVDKNGLVTAKRKGVARITVTTKEGKKASCKVKVLNY